MSAKDNARGPAKIRKMMERRRTKRAARQRSSGRGPLVDEEVDRFRHLGTPRHGKHKAVFG